MTEDSQAPQSAESESWAPTEAAAALLDGTLAKYRRALGQDAEKAQSRYGFTLFHSLGPEEKVTHLSRLGFEPRDGIDHYNLGCVAALQGNFEQAVEHFEKALADDPTLQGAAHNLALALERAGRLDKARAQWRRCLEMGLSAEDRAEIESHLKELG